MRLDRKENLRKLNLWLSKIVQNDSKAKKRTK